MALHETQIKMLSKLNCFKSSEFDENTTINPNPWSFPYNKTGAQIFYNSNAKQFSYLNPVTLKELQADGKDGHDLVVTMLARDGESYGVDYGFPPEGKIRWQRMMPLEEREKLRGEEQRSKEITK